MSDLAIRSVVGETILPPRAPFFSFSGETSRFPPNPFPHAHGPGAAP